MMRYIYLLFLFLCCSFASRAQSIELMAGDQRIFTDIQWLKFFEGQQRWSIFSRTRATVDYDNQTNLFSGAYLNYTSKTGLGVSTVGKIGNSGAGVDLGPHYFKAKSNWMLFGLASVGLKEQLEYSWFSIFRFTPKLNEKWKWYSSLELFSLWQQGRHQISVQRVRLGVDYQKTQFGFAINLSQIGNSQDIQSNVGGFIRKSF